MSSTPIAAPADHPTANAKPVAGHARHPTSRRLDLAAAAVVFGCPFAYCLHGAVRGQLFLGRYAFFGNASPISDLLAWIVATALGSLGLGVSLQLGLISRLNERARSAAAAGLIFSGAALLLMGARLLSLRAS